LPRPESQILMETLTASFFSPAGAAMTPTFGADVGIRRSELVPVAAMRSLPPVCDLDRPGGPTAIFRAVWAVVIDSVDGVIRRRTLPHVSQEVGELFPAVTNEDPPSAVVLEVRPIGIGASGMDCLPSVILGCALPIARVPMLDARFPQFGIETATGLASPRPDVSRVHNCPVSTGADAFPVSPLSEVDFRYGDPSPISLPVDEGVCHILKFDKFRANSYTLGVN
jgi:hypothetical protein